MIDINDKKKMAAILTVLAEEPRGVPESTIYLALNSDINLWNSYRDAMKIQGWIKVSGHLVTLTAAGRDLVKKINDGLKKIQADQKESNG